MKKLWLLAGMLFGGFAFSIAQPYEPMVVEGAHWRYAEIDHTDVAPYAEIYEYYIRGDTVVNNITYKKLYWRLLGPTIFSYDPPYQPIASQPFPLVGLREDTTSQQVFAFYFNTGSFLNPPCADSSDSSEVMLFDFSYGVGDTVALCRYQFSPSDTFAIDTVVRIIDTTFFGYSRRSIETSLGVWFIQGVGGGWNRGYPGQKLKSEMVRRILIQLPGYNWPLSFFLDHHCVGNDEQCEVITSLDHGLISNVRIEVFPQPASSLLQVQIGAPESYRVLQIRLFSQEGKVLLSSSVSNAQFSIPIEQLSNGLYFLELSSGNTILGYEKVLINR